jgi:outer membrane protein TolC
MKRFLGVILLISFTALANPGKIHAQVPLTWQDCVGLAAQNNPDLLAALNAMAASRADYRGSYNGILPQLSLTNRYTKGGASGGTDPSLWTLTGNASLNVIDFSQWASIQESLATYKQSQANVRVTSSAALLDLYRAYTSLLYAQEAIQVNAAILDIWKTNAQMVNLRYQSGRESKGNNMNTQAQFLQAETAVEQSKRELRVAQQALSQALGKDSFNVLIVTGSWSTAAVPQPHPDLDTLLISEPRILIQEAQVEQARAAIKNAHSTLWPSLALNYSKGTAGPTEFPQNPFWAFTGTLNYPLFAGGPTATYYASQSAERKFDQARQNLKSIKNQARTDLESAWAGFASAEDQIRVQRAFLQAARQRKEESDVRYQSGLMSFEDWIRVVTEYVNFQTSFLRTEQNLILAEAQWRFAKGDPL